MIKIPPIKKVSFNLQKFSSRKAVKFTSLIADIVIIMSVLIFIFFPDPIINSFLKERITKAFIEAYPEYSLQLGDLHFNVWRNRLSCDSIKLDSKDSTLNFSATSFSVGGIGWLKLISQREVTSNILACSEIDAQNINFTFHRSNEGIRFGKIHISVPDSEMATDSVKYYSLLEDEQLFAKSKFRQTRFRFDIPKMEIIGLDYLSLFQGKKYIARSIRVSKVFADILVNMDKPYDKSSSKPQMPNELLLSIKEIVKIDSLKIIDGRLKYCERFVVRAKPGVITFSKVNVSINGIANQSDKPDTTFIRGQGIFMNSAIMKLRMAIPTSTKDFSLRYSGSLSTMDVTKLNAFIEPGEHHRIKSGTIQYASYNINVHSGHSSGTLKVVYKDLSIAILDKKSGSEKGVFNRILSFIGKIFIIRGNNMPDEKGKIKIGTIKYLRDRDDYFLQFLWFSLRNGVADVVGFPSK